MVNDGAIMDGKRWWPCLGLLGVVLMLNACFNKRDAWQHSTDLKKGVVVYFDAQGRYGDAPSLGGFFRVVIGRHSHTRYWVQDFYAVGGRKRTGPMLIMANQLRQFDAVSLIDAPTIYAPDGRVVHKSSVQRR